MENLIFLVIDSLGNKNNNALGFSVMPFLDELKKKSFYCPNMYSQAPYTEAAVMSMLCGRETMNEGGYFYRFRDAKNMFDYFYEAGYDVMNFIQPHVHASSIRRGNREYYYNVCHDFHVLFSYRLSFYATKIKTSPLTKKEYNKIEVLMEDNFEECIFFYDSFLKKDSNMSFIQKNLDKVYSKEVIERAVITLNQEYRKYKRNATSYIDELLAQAYDHVLFQLPVMDQKEKVLNDTKEWVQREWTSTFEEIRMKNKSMNKKISKFSMKQFTFLVYKYLRTRDILDLKSIVWYLQYYQNSFKDCDLYERINSSYDNFKSAPSMDKHTQHFYDWLDQGYEEPYMACIHVDDIHNPEIFFTYDSDDKDMLREELEVCKAVIEKCDATITGSLTYYLSLAYIDLKMKRFFEQLEKRGVLENTRVVITGDHGFSFDDVIIRPSRVNNFYLENYQIPFLCYDKNKEAQQINEKCSSKDILPTILDLFNIDAGPLITGHSLFDDVYVKDRTIITSEYVGGGCPEMDAREILICGHDLVWLVVAAVTLSDNRQIHLKEVYHLKSDPHQMKNLVFKKVQDEHLTSVIDTIEQRYQELYENYRNYMGEK